MISVLSIILLLSIPLVCYASCILGQALTCGANVSSSRSASPLAFPESDHRKSCAASITAFPHRHIWRSFTATTPNPAPLPYTYTHALPHTRPPITTTIMLPLTLLTAATGHPMLVELKSGETLNGHLTACDTWMNLTLKEVVQTSAEGDRFVRLKESYVRGNNVSLDIFHRALVGCWTWDGGIGSS